LSTTGTGEREGGRTLPAWVPTVLMVLMMMVALSFTAWFSASVTTRPAYLTMSAEAPPLPTGGSAWGPAFSVEPERDSGVAPATATPPADSDDESAPFEVEWSTLAGLDFTTGVMTEELRALDGRRVRMPGFMVPLEDTAVEVTEFLLVPYFGACIHYPPPPPNQMVYVRMQSDERTRVSFWHPLWVEGRLEIVEVDSPYGAVSFHLTGQRIAPYEE